MIGSKAQGSPSRTEVEASLVTLVPGFASRSRMFGNHSGSFFLCDSFAKPCCGCDVTRITYFIPSWIALELCAMDPLALEREWRYEIGSL